MGKKINRQHKLFVEKYIKSWNQTQAAIDAGYSAASAAQTANKILKRPEVKEYMRRRIEDQDSRVVADANETLAFFTSVMRGEVADQFGLDASLNDRLAAGRELMKRFDAVAALRPGQKKEEDALSRALREEAEKMERERVKTDAE